MNPLFKKAKYIFIIYFLLIAFVSFVPSNMAAFGDIYICQSIIEIDYDKNLTNKPLLPIDMILDRLHGKPKQEIESKNETTIKGSLSVSLDERISKLFESAKK